MVAWYEPPDTDELFELLSDCNARLAAEKARRLDAALKQLAEMGAGSALFSALREQYAQSDPAFRARMEAQASS